jgi:hypothetical protein
MAAPNLAAPTSITGKTAWLAPANTSEATLLSNAASSNRALRITSLIVSNISATASADATVKVYNAASAGTGFDLCRTLTVPVGASINVLDRASSVWLEEDRRITAQASVASALTFTVSYEEVA